MTRDPATLDEVLTVLRSEGDALGARAGIKLVGLVGSLARGEARPDSDIDIVFDARPDLDYLRLGGLIMMLRERFGRSVDLVDREMMRPDRWKWMSRDFIPIR